MMSEREPELLLYGTNAYASGRRNRLEQALEKALQWQTALEGEPVEVNDHVYQGPHKWIVCLVGSDSYAVKQFTASHQKRFADKQNQNLSISVMALSSDPLGTIARDYQLLAASTSEGNYINIVDVDKADIVAGQFLANMDVYPSNDMPVIKEFFQTI